MASHTISRNQLVQPQAVDHRAADEDAESRHQRQRRHREAARDIRPPDAHDPDADAHQDEGEQRPDAGHLAHDVAGNERREEPGEHEEQTFDFHGVWKRG